MSWGCVRCAQEQRRANRSRLLARGVVLAYRSPWWLRLLRWLFVRPPYPRGWW